MLNIDDLREEMEERVEEVIDFYTSVTPKELGLDPRSARELFINKDYIACPSGDRRTLDYYGGFEYVDKGSVFTLGNYTFYSREDDRVQGHLDTYFEKDGDEFAHLERDD